MKRCSAVIHFAAVAHFARKSAQKNNGVDLFHINTQGATETLQKAISLGVKKFIFLSSIGAVQNSSSSSLSPGSFCVPLTDYGKSKYAAEENIKKAIKGTQISYTIIRPPLVYGPKNPGNMAKLLRIVDTSLPLPLSALDSNKRSFVGISNLIDLILLCLEHPAATNQTFHVSDDDDISTAELLRRIGKALGKPVRNLPIPQTVLSTGLRLLGKGEWIDKFCGDLRVDISETKRMLGWKPKVAMEEELRRTALWWRESRQGRL